MRERKSSKTMRSHAVAGILFLGMLLMCLFAMRTAAAASDGKQRYSISMKVGQRSMPEIQVPEGVKITWKSTKSKVASVDQHGVISAKKPGKATIVAKVQNQTIEFLVTVKKNVRKFYTKAQLKKEKAWKKVYAKTKAKVCGNVYQVSYDAEGRMCVDVALLNRDAKAHKLKKMQITVTGDKGKVLATGTVSLKNEKLASGRILYGSVPLQTRWWVDLAKYKIASKVTVTYK